MSKFREAIIKTLITVHEGSMCIRCAPSGILTRPRAFGSRSGQDAFRRTLNTHTALMNSHLGFIHVWKNRGMKISCIKMIFSWVKMKFPCRKKIYSCMEMKILPQTFMGENVEVAWSCMKLYTAQGPMKFLCRQNHARGAFSCVKCMKMFMLEKFIFHAWW